jgi:hypothetical protein
MLIWLVFGIFVHVYPSWGPYDVWVGTLLLFVLLLLLGWKVFGPPLHG